MFTIKKLLITSSILAFTTVINFSIAKESDLSKPNAAKGSLKLVMQGLLADTQALTAAMLMEDFTSIEKIAKETSGDEKLKAQVWLLYVELKMNGKNSLKNLCEFLDKHKDKKYVQLVLMPPKTQLYFGFHDFPFIPLKT